MFLICAFNREHDLQIYSKAQWPQHIIFITFQRTFLNISKWSALYVTHWACLYHPIYPGLNEAYNDFGLWKEAISWNETTKVRIISVLINKNDIFYKNYCPATFCIFHILAAQNLKQSEVKHFPKSKTMTYFNISKSFNASFNPG